MSNIKERSTGQVVSHIGETRAINNQSLFQKKARSFASKVMN